MSRLLRMLRGRLLLLATKTAVASGIAFFLGSLLPAPLDDYKYYAALGAFTVVGLVLVDSVKESLQVLGAVATGVGLALVVQTLSWTNALTVALVIGAGVLLGSSRVFGVQRTWVPLAALFVLATGGVDPEPMALGYLVQVPLGALVGMIVNVVVFAPLGNDDVAPATTHLLRLLSTQMRRYADLLDEQSRTEGPDAEGRRAGVLRGAILQLEHAQARLRAAINEAGRAQSGNPRSRLRSREGRQEEVRRAEATCRCAATLLAVGVMLDHSRPSLDDESIELRKRAVDALEHAAAAFEDPEAAYEHPDVLARSRESLAHLRSVTRPSANDGGLHHVLFGALTVVIGDCLDTFTRHVLEVDIPEDDQGAPRA